jgi:putative tricarboxylic transport membrane protein
MKQRGLVGAVAISLAASLGPAGASAGVGQPECIAPARAGGAFELTCEIVRRGLHAGKFLAEPMRVTYMPGGVGAVAYSAIAAQRPGEGNTLVAFSGGSLLNLAQGKFGKYTESDVRWLAAIGKDHGMVAVRADSPMRSLHDLVAAMKRDPTKVVFGVSGTAGGQDWVKVALVATAAGIDPKTIRYVSFEGGGEALIALLSGHVQAVSGDISEATGQLEGGKMRVLAIFSDQRLPGDLANVPTAKEQGFAIVWAAIRGVYMGPKVRDADYAWWVRTFEAMMAMPEFAKAREERGMFPFSSTGPELEAVVRKTVREYADLTKMFGLRKK